MSAKGDNERLRLEVEGQRQQLEEAQDLAEAQLRNIERVSQMVCDRDSENVTLAKKLQAAVAAQGSMPADLETLKRIVNDHIVEGLTGGPTAGIVLARRLRTEMVEAGFPVDTEVEIRTQLGGLS